MMELNNKMSSSDREIFTVSLEEFSKNTGEYIKNVVHGASKYFFKETKEDLMKAHRKLFIFKILHYILLFMIYTALLYFGFQILNQLRHLLK